MAGLSPAAERTWVAASLPKVSRTFALTIRLLPGALEHPVAVAYLLCRIADTIEDSATLTAAEKCSLLGEFRAAIGGGSTAGLERTFAAARTDDERLARDASLALTAFHRLAPAAQASIRPRVEEMCDGMGEFARARGDGGALYSVPDLAALDRYCYYVAGTVGHLLTGLFVDHLPGIDPERQERLRSLATSFGLGLQLTNIIKDIAADRTRGWSFVPANLCRQFGFAPEQLLDPAHRAAATEAMRTLIAKARKHLDDAVSYCTLLPRSAYGVRMFCLLAVFLAIRTLRLAERDPRLLEPAEKLKITRREVRATLAMTALTAPSDRLVRAYFGSLARA
jgi:farnesyl-diphosphate farnesyltransferase